MACSGQLEGARVGDVGTVEHGSIALYTRLKDIVTLNDDEVIGARHSNPKVSSGVLLEIATDWLAAGIGSSANKMKLVGKGVATPCQNSQCLLALQKFSVMDAPQFVMFELQAAATWGSAFAYAATMRLLLNCTLDRKACGANVKMDAPFISVSRINELGHCVGPHIPNPGCVIQSLVQD